MIFKLLFKLRWWKWCLWGAKPLPIEAMYIGPAKLDKQSRMIILDRNFNEWMSREPKVHCSESDSPHPTKLSCNN